MPKIGRSDRLLVLIGVFKLVKAALLVAVATGALELLRRSATHPIYDALTFLPIERHPHLADWLSRQVSALTPHRLELVSIGAGVYAALFVLEGVGLLLRKRWGEIVTVVITGSFIPLEIYELVHHASIGKVVAVALNVAIVVYLIWRLQGGRPAPISARRRATL